MLPFGTNVHLNAVYFDFENNDVKLSCDLFVNQMKELHRSLTASLQLASEIHSFDLVAILERSGKQLSPDIVKKLI